MRARHLRGFVEVWRSILAGGSDATAMKARRVNRVRQIMRRRDRYRRQRNKENATINLLAITEA